MERPYRLALRAPLSRLSLDGELPPDVGQHGCETCHNAGAACREWLRDGGPQDADDEDAAAESAGNASATSTRSWSSPEVRRSDCTTDLERAPFVDQPAESSHLPFKRAQN